MSEAFSRIVDLAPSLVQRCTLPHSLHTLECNRLNEEAVLNLVKAIGRLRNVVNFDMARRFNRSDDKSEQGIIRAEGYAHGVYDSFNGEAILDVLDVLRAAQPPGELIWTYPECPVCDSSKDMEHDDGWVCVNCGAAWSEQPGDEGTWV